jgi:hypothetical protein
MSVEWMAALGRGTAATALVAPGADRAQVF